MSDAVQYLGETPLFPLAKYVRELKAHLTPEELKPARSRLLLIPLHLAIIVIATLAIARGWVPWPVFPLLGIVIGIGFACLTFVAHEGLHGGIVRSKLGKHLIGLVGFMPFMVSPRLWVAWHDRVHHANANMPEDPDMYPSLVDYNGNARIKWFVDKFSFGNRRKRGVLSLILGFTVQSAHQLIVSTTRGFLSADQRRKAIAESILGFVVWGTLAYLVGFIPFLFVYVMPLVLANMIVMAFILTNHSLSPLIPVNDPLVSGLSVTSNRFIELITLRFGYHVEHHLFPAMSSRHAHRVRDLLVERWPERYQAMPLTAAIAELYRTARVYKDAITLIDPPSGKEYPVLMPRPVVVAGPALAA